jgi:hypothetical protein
MCMFELFDCFIPGAERFQTMLDTDLSPEVANQTPNRKQWLQYLLGGFRMSDQKTQMNEKEGFSRLICRTHINEICVTESCSSQRLADGD